MTMTMAGDDRGSDFFRRQSRLFRAAIGLCGLVTALTVASCTRSTGPAREEAPRPGGRAPARPNVLLIVADDLAATLGAYGHPVVSSPGIDRLAGEGVLFERAYSQYPLCNPSRASLLSGRRPETTHVVDNQTRPRRALGPAVDFLPGYFKRHGYYTARIGKIFHVARFLENGKPTVSMDDPGSWHHSEDEHVAASRYDLRKHIVRHRGFEGKRERQDWASVDAPDDMFGDGIVARRGIELLEAASQRRQPFFLAVGFRRPHLPYVAPAKYFELYDPARIPLPDGPPDDRDDIPAPALTASEDDDLTNRETREIIAAYYASVSFMDAQVARLLDALDRLHLRDRTIVVFLGDHGYHLGEHGLWRKNTLFEEVARAPLVISAPGGRRGARSPALVEMVDLYPTLVEASGLPLPRGLEGTSLVPLLHEPTRHWKAAAFATVVRRGGATGRSVATDRYRFTDWGAAGAELYDHRSDPREYRNLARDPAHRETVDRLRRVLADGWRAATPTAAEATP